MSDNTIGLVRDYEVEALSGSSYDSYHPPLNSDHVGSEIIPIFDDLGSEGCMRLTWRKTNYSSMSLDALTSNMNPAGVLMPPHALSEEEIKLIYKEYTLL